MTTHFAIKFAAVTLVCAARAVPAQTAEQIIDRHVAAIGGRDALAAVETMRYTRTVLNTREGVTTQQSRKTFYMKRPYFYRAEDVETGRIYISDGRAAWVGRRAVDSDSIIWEEASFVLRSRDLDFDGLFGSFIDFSGKGHGAEFAGTVEMAGVQLDVVRVTWKEGEEWDFYFASSTGLCYGFTTNREGPSDLTRVTDYRRVGGILIAHRNTSVNRLPDGGTRLHERVYADIVFNVVLSDSMFMPVIE